MGFPLVDIRKDSFTEIKENCRWQVVKELLQLGMTILLVDTLLKLLRLIEQGRDGVPIK